MFSTAFSLLPDRCSPPAFCDACHDAHPSSWCFPRVCTRTKSSPQHPAPRFSSPPLFRLDTIRSLNNAVSLEWSSQFLLLLSPWGICFGVRRACEGCRPSVSRSFFLPPPLLVTSLSFSLSSLFSPSSRLFILLVWYHVTTSAVLEQLVVGPPSSAVLFRFSFPAFIPPVVFLFRSSLLGFLGRVATGSEFPFSVRPRGSCLPALTTEAAAIFPLRFLRLAGFHLFAPSSPQFSHILLSFWFLPRTERWAAVSSSPRSFFASSLFFFSFAALSLACACCPVIAWFSNAKD